MCVQRRRAERAEVGAWDGVLWEAEVGFQWSDGGGNEGCKCELLIESVNYSEGGGLLVSVPPVPSGAFDKNQTWPAAADRAAADTTASPHCASQCYSAWAAQRDCCVGHSNSGAAPEQCAAAAAGAATADTGSGHQSRRGCYPAPAGSARSRATAGSSMTCSHRSS